MRTFLVVVLLAAVGLGWLAIIVERGREQRKAVQAIQALDGFVEYAEPSNAIERNEWLQKVLGDDTLGEQS